MTTELGVEAIRAWLAGHDITVQELPADTSTAISAAAALGTSVPTIVKSLLFMADGVPLLVLASGDRRVNTRALAREIGARKVRMATRDECIAHAGYAPGGVPPVGHREVLRALLDRRLLDFPVVYAAAGSPHAVFAITPHQLHTLTGAELTDAAE
ncbi:MAG TPA: YbaK/EbsC family protein [Chloroflexota bacterium]|nr:YbaK/EbsC family protein [Chloroflexota bacterium]